MNIIFGIMYRMKILMNGTMTIMAISGFGLLLGKKVIIHQEIAIMKSGW